MDFENWSWSTALAELIFVARILIGSSSSSGELGFYFDWVMLTFGPSSQFSNRAVRWTTKLSISKLRSVGERCFSWARFFVSWVFADSLTLRPEQDSWLVEVVVDGIGSAFPTFQPFPHVGPYIYSVLTFRPLRGCSLLIFQPSWDCSPLNFRPSRDYKLSSLSLLSSRKNPWNVGVSFS